MKFGSQRFSWFLLLLLFHSCKDETLVTPVVSTYGAPVYRQPVDTNLEFEFSMPHTHTLDVSVDYTTMDGTAVAGVDFISTSGTVTIPAGSLSATVTVKILKDSLRRDAQIFYLNLSNPKNCKTTKGSIVGKIENDGLYLPIDDAGYSTPDFYSGYTLVWRDEFNDKLIDENVWTFETGNNSGWGNNELEFYTGRPQNVFVSLGNLIIEARKEKYQAADFTSTRMTTKSKKSFKYGRIDVRAKVPVVNGTLAEIRMLGSNVDEVGHPACGEIDIMQMGRKDNMVFQTLHWGNSPTESHQLGSPNWLGNVSENKFHVFSVVWDSNHIEMFIDDDLMRSLNMSTEGETLPFNNHFFFIFNLAVGGNWPRPPDGTAQFPQRLVVDYVRVFQ